MAIKIQNLEIYEGNSDTMTLTIGTGSTDITDYTVTFTVKSAIGDSDASALIKKAITSHTSPLTGVTTISILPSDTNGQTAGSYPYDIRYDDGTGTISTIMKGKFKIVQCVGDLD